MALIECPNCKKQVSDTRETCIHCGFVLPTKNENTQQNIDSVDLNNAPSEESIKKFTSLKQEEKDKLWDEFYNNYPKYWKLKNKEYNNKKISYCASFSMLVYLCYVLLYRLFFYGKEIVNKFFFTFSVFLSVALLISGIIIALVCKFNKSLYAKKDLIVLKRFQNW